MFKGKRYILSAALVWVVLVLAGCGISLFRGHSGAPSTTGSITLRIIWPAEERGRLIPQLTKSIGVKITKGSTVVVKDVIARAEGQQQVNKVYSNVPIGTVNVEVCAYSSSDGTGTPLAAGSTNVAVVANVSTPVTITMSSTIAVVEVSPQSPSVCVGYVVQLTATAKDAGGNIVMVPVGGYEWTSSNPAVATVDSNGLVTGKSEGSAIITAKEKESGKSGSATVNVGIPPTGESYVFVTKWGREGSGDGEFRYPYGIAVDSAGYVYIADTKNNRIQKFTSDGKFVAKWGGNGWSDGEFNDPEGIAVDSAGYVYVADTLNNRIQKFTSDGKFVAKWGGFGSGDGEFSIPIGIAVDSAGYVYIADTFNDRIQKFTSDGKFVAQWGGHGWSEGEFNHPEGIAVDSAGYVYVVDAFNHRIQKFTSDGKFVAKWGGNGWSDGEFNDPYGIAVDSAGYVYVADTFNDRIQKFTSDGKFVAKWGRRGSGDGEFAGPHGIAVDSAGYVYVADGGNHRIQKFRRAQ